MCMAYSKVELFAKGLLALIEDGQLLHLRQSFRQPCPRLQRSKGVGSR